MLGRLPDRVLGVRMRGKILQYDDSAATGLISGDDGKRYTFTRGDLQGEARLAYPGAEADYQAEGEAARAIFLQPLAPGGAAGAPLGAKSKIAAALLAFFLGMFGVHKFYLGRTGPGIIMLICGTIGWLLILPGLAVATIAFIEFIIYLVKSDAEFFRDYEVGKKGWF